MICRNKAPVVSDAPRLASYPHPYPDGWYRLASSDSIRPGTARYVECLGGQFVIWREQDSGDVHVMDAFCPHLGANLALGRVRGDCIECPFHRWQFTGEGRVRHIPYSESPPSRVLAKPFPVAEVHGDIFFYHRTDGAESDDDSWPTYEVPRVAEMDDGSFVYRGHHDWGRVRTHIIEIAENAVDTAHFQPMHGQFHVPWTQIPLPGIQIEYSTEWKLDGERPWAKHLLVDAVLRVFGRRVDRIETHVRVSFWGPSVSTFRFTIPGKGEIEMYQTFLPVGPLEQQVDFRWFADRKLPRLLVRYIVGNWISQFAFDAKVWETKIYRSHPHLCRDDGPVHRMRRWYRQFQPEAPTTIPAPTLEP